MNRVIGQKAVLQIFIVPNSVLGGPLLWEFSSDERSVGKCEVWHFCFAQTAIIIVILFRSTLIENRFKERKKRKQNFNSKLTRRKCRLFPWAPQPELSFMVFLHITYFCPLLPVEILGHHFYPEIVYKYIYIYMYNKKTRVTSLCPGPKIQCWGKKLEWNDASSYILHSISYKKKNPFD